MHRTKKEDQRLQMKSKSEITDREKPIRVIADLSMETLNARRPQNKVFHFLKEHTLKKKEHTCQPKLLYQRKLFVRLSEKKIFP